MKLRKIVALGLAAAVAASAALPAMAEDPKPAAAPAAAKPAEPAKPAEAAKPAAAAKKKSGAQPKTEVKATVTGKLEAKKVKNKKTGKDQEILVLTVATAVSADGKDMPAYKGKPLRAGGKKELNLKSFAGKDVTITGTIVNQRRLNVETIK